METMFPRKTISDSANTREQAKPVGRHDKYKHRGEEPKRLANEFGSDDRAEEIVQAFNQPLPEILRPVRNVLHGPNAQTNSQDQQQRHNPSQNHGIGHRQRSNVKNDGSRGGQALLLGDLDVVSMLRGNGCQLKAQFREQKY